MPRKKRTTKSASKRQGPSTDASTSELLPGSLLTSDSPQPNESITPGTTAPRTQQKTKENQSTKGTRRQRHGNVDDHASAMTSDQWTVLRKKIMADWCKDQGHQPLGDTRDSNGVPTKSDMKCDGDGPFGLAEKDGALYRWGWATATNEACPLEVEWLSRLATGATCSQKRFRAIDASRTAAEFQERMAGATGDSGEWHSAMEATIWAAALPRLLDHLEENEWWSLLGSLQNFREVALSHSSSDPMSLLAVAEVGLTLSMVLRALPSCRRLRSSSLTTFTMWCEQDDRSVSATLLHPQRVRFVLASLIRCRRIASLSSGGKQLLKSSKALAVELGTWIAGMTRSGGCQSFSVASKSQVRDDLGSSGLLLTVANFEKDSLLPAMKAAIGMGKSNGRLAWQVHLPESMLHDEDSKLACLLPEWDERRARLVVSYLGADVQVEIIAGKSAVVSGVMETHVAVDGTTLEGADQWILTCEYTDDDVHYLELEQPLNNGFLLQRQLMLIREDLSCLIADAVLQSQPASESELATDAKMVDYQLRIPLGVTMEAIPEPETNEVILGDSHHRAVVIPLSTPEWKTPALSPSTQSRQQSRFEVSSDNHLVVKARCHGQLYAPIWFDLCRERFGKRRTWRQLTVAQNLEPVSASLASAYRLQMGKQHWVFYRSMAGNLPRTFFGRQMIADFYCARFDAKQQSFEDLITVENNE